MLARRGNRYKDWKKPSSTTRGADRSAGQKTGRKSEQMQTASRFAVLAQMDEEQAMGTLERRRKIWVPVKSNSEHGLSKATEQGVGASVEEGVGTEGTLEEEALQLVRGGADLMEITKMNERKIVARVGQGKSDVESKGNGGAKMVKGKDAIIIREVKT